MKVAFLGAGRMASAMVEGLLAQKIAGPRELACLGGDDDTASRLAARTGIPVARSPEELMEGADAVVVAFKPQNLASADPLLGQLARGRLVLSILAGKRLATLEAFFAGARALVRCMPNTPGQVGAGVTAWCSSRPLSEADRTLVGRLLGSLGRALELPEAQMDAVTALSGSGPGYVFEFAGALREAGIAAGLPPEAAEELAVRTLIGSARLLERRAAPPEQLRDEVVSPGGTTAAGLRVLAEADFRGLIRRMVLAAKARSEELGRD